VVENVLLSYYTNNIILIRVRDKTLPHCRPDNKYDTNIIIMLRVYNIYTYVININMRAYDLFDRTEIHPRQKPHKSDRYGSGTTGRQQRRYYIYARAPVYLFLLLSGNIRYAFKTVYAQCIVT